MHEWIGWEERLQGGEGKVEDERRERRKRKKEREGKDEQRGWKAKKSERRMTI